MNFPWLKNARCPIGIDVGAHSVKLLQLEPTAQGYRVAAAASRTLPPDLPASGADRTAAISRLIREAIDSAPFTGRRVVSSMPASSIQYKNLRLPKMPIDELRTAVAWEAVERLRLPQDAAQIQFINAGDVRQGEEQRLEIILLAAMNSAVDEHLEILTRAELTPVAIDAVPAALARCIAHSQPEAGEVADVVLDVGFASSKVLIMRGGQILFFKLIDIGGQKLDQTVSQRLNMPVADAADIRRRLQRVHRGEDSGEEMFGATRRETLERAVFESLRMTAGELAKEVGLCLRYYSVTFRGKRPERMLLIGGEAYETQLARILAEGADIQVEQSSPLRGIDVSSATELCNAGTPLSEWAVAAGLSMRTEARAAKRGAA